MKHLLLSLAFLTGIISFGQVQTTIADGNFWNPFIWDCSCLPADGDSLVINHNLSLTSGIAYTSGQILINSSGTLDQGANNYSFFINGGSLINHGTLVFDDLWLENGFITNTGTANLDSVYTGSTVNNTGTITTAALAHDEGATFTNDGNIDIANNYYNSGWFVNNGILTVTDSAANCNTQTLNAVFTNDGFFCIAGSFGNCANDTLTGDGTVFIGGTSWNDGEVNGTLLINTPTSGFTFNTGTVAGTVTFGSDACAAGVDESEKVDWNIYPNPATTEINCSEQHVSYHIYDMTGRQVLSGNTYNGQIAIDQLQQGSYVIQLQNTNKELVKKTFIKL